MVLKCAQTWQAAPRRRPLAIAQLTFRSSRATFQVLCDCMRRGERRAYAGGSCVPVHLAKQALVWCCTLTPSLLPPQTLSFSGARTLTSAFGSAPWARRSSIAATWPVFAAQCKAVQPRCEGARKGTRHERYGEHETRAPQHRRARPGVTSVGSGRSRVFATAALPRAQAAGQRAGGVGMLP